MHKIAVLVGDFEKNSCFKVHPTNNMMCVLERHSKKYFVSLGIASKMAGQLSLKSVSIKLEFYIIHYKVCFTSISEIIFE